MSATTGTPMYNLNVLNIIDLQNTATTASGISVTDAVDQLGLMVNFENKRVNADIIGSYTPNGAINVVSPLNVTDGSGITVLSNADQGNPYDLYVYGTVYSSNLQSLCPLKFTVGHENPLQVMQLTEEGHVGIMTLDPKATLDCAGTAIFRDTTVFKDKVVFEGAVSFKQDVVFEGNVIIKGKLLGEGRSR